MKRIMLMLVVLAISKTALASSALLTTPVRLTIPNSTGTVQEAIEWMLSPINYNVVGNHQGGEKILNQPAPKFSDVHSTVPLIEAVSSVVGKDNTILIDHNHKLITFVEGSK